MIGPTDTNAIQAISAHGSPAKAQQVLSMKKNARMAGSVPVWSPVVTAKQGVERELSLAQYSTETHSFDDVLAYNKQMNDINGRAQTDGFGFGDLVDMVNPLHHIPIVGHVYRSVTGDQIKPIGQIIGGAVFGGVAGAAGNLVSVIVEEETGKSLAQNAVDFAFKNEKPVYKSERNKPEQALAAAETQKEPELPPALLAFAAQPYTRIETPPTIAGPGLYDIY